MLVNAKTAISTSKVLLVPYSPWHVPRYHEWMKDEEIQAATASEPLSIDEEYAMQQSWRRDPDKLTFIVCLPLPASRQSQWQSDDIHAHAQAKGETKADRLHDDDDSPARMLGDINLFLRLEDGEDGTGESQLVGEVELMIAEKARQGSGYGRAALLGFLRYVIEHEGEILREFVEGDEGVRRALGGGGGGGGAAAATGLERLKFSALSVKIGKENGRSLALFESVGFVKMSEEPSYFGEFELRRTDLGGESVQEAMGRAGMSGYTEVVYERTQ